MARPRTPRCSRARSGPVCVTVDSLDELERLDALARGLGRRALVRLRLRPHTPELTLPSDLLDAPVPVADVVLAYKPASGRPGRGGGGADRHAEGLDALGVHMHFPRHVADPGPRRRRLAPCAALILA